MKITKNSKKEVFKLHSIGNPDKRKVLLIHGISFFWENCFQGIINELQDEYYLLIPELQGHNPHKKGKISSVYASAKQIIEELHRKNYGDVYAVYGISMGASIALEIAFQKEINIKKLIIDGGQYESMGIMKRIYAYIISKQLLKIMQKKHMMKSIQKKMGYCDNDVEILKSLTCETVKFKALYAAALAAYSYSIEKRQEKLEMEVIVMCGTDEIYAQRSIPIVKRKCKNIFVYESQEKGHAETLGKTPEKIANIIRSTNNVFTKTNQ